jgi:hypothetical protein
VAGIRFPILHGFAVKDFLESIFVFLGMKIEDATGK